MVLLSPIFCATVPPRTYPLLEVIGPFVAWSPPTQHDGEIVRYIVKITSSTGAYVILQKSKMDVYHMLEREDVPIDLGRSTLIGIQVMYANTPSESTLCHCILKAHNFLGNKCLEN